jgi:hypothetical protein
VVEVSGASVSPNTAAIGDTINVRTEDLDGWLISKIDAGYLNDDPFVSKYWKDFGPLVVTDSFDWDEIVPESLSAEVAKKYGPGLSAVRNKFPGEAWRSAVLEARGAFNGFVRRKASELKLVIDDVRFENLKAEVVELIPGPENSSGETVFHSTYRLLRNSDNNATWQRLLHQFKFKRPVRLTLGLQTTNGTWVFMPTRIVPDPDPEKSPFQLQLVDLRWFLAAVVVIIVALVLFALLVGPTDLLRDVDARPRPAGDGNQTVYPVSLARSQMTFWFFLVMAAYLFIWLTTERLDGLNEQMLGLIGISAATALGAAFVSAGKGPLRTLTDEAARVNNPALSAADQEAARLRVARLTAQNERLVKSRPFGRVMDDLLSEDGAISFHRFQMLAWTLVLGLIFISHVCANYAMPAFSATTLGLMGISAGTYLGFKLPDTR